MIQQNCVSLLLWSNTAQTAHTSVHIVDELRAVLMNSRLRYSYNNNVACHHADVLKGQVAWITGASSGIGKHIAYQLARVGCKLVLSARSTTELENVRKDCLSLYPFLPFLLYVISSVRSKFRSFSLAEKPA